ncbi:MAG: DNA helicase UvrD [Candidatus Thiodiazotropha sp.]
MAKELVLAVAGSGKTTKILEAVTEEKRSLVVTYTNENLRSLEESLHQKFGYIPTNITLITYFSFLYSFCFRPFFSYGLRDNGIFWEIPGVFPPKSNPAHYITESGYLYGNRVAKYVQEHGGIPKIIARLEKYFDDFLIDEIQDFAANDFNLITTISDADIDFLLVGDYFQHTFDTSRDGQIRTNLHKNGLGAYLEEFENKGFSIDTSSLSKTHRCSPSVCDFITDHIGIGIESHRDDNTEVTVVEDVDTALLLFQDDDKVKLFFQDHGKYDCNSNNWGKCKGLNNYGDVCVVLNKKSSKLFRSGALGKLPESSRNKLYVACSRVNGSLYVLFEEHLSGLKN